MLERQKIMRTHPRTLTHYHAHLTHPERESVCVCVCVYVCMCVYVCVYVRCLWFLCLPCLSASNRGSYA
jgi:hypothetical protein